MRETNNFYNISILDRDELLNLFQREQFDECVA